MHAPLLADSPALFAPLHPFTILTIGIVAVIGLIVVFRVHAFLALILSAALVSALAPGPIEDTLTRVAFEFGSSAGKIGIVIALASIIGACMMESGASDRIVRAFLSLLGEKRASFALLGSGYILAMPVFFDTVFYLLVPLARSLYRKTARDYLLYIMAIAAGGAITHTLVPPTPGPLLIAAQLNVDLGLMILMGIVVAAPSAVAGLAFAAYRNRVMPVPMREVAGSPDPDPIPDHRLPPLWLSVLPVVLPVALISMNTVTDTLARQEEAPGVWRGLLPYAKLYGDANFALLLSTFVAILLYWRQRRPTLKQVGDLTEQSLLSGGVIILITAAGGAFGAMLKAAGIGDAIKDQFADATTSGLMYLFLGFGVSSVLKIAQGSSTVAMITTSGMLAAMVGGGDGIGFHLVYLALAIGAGSLVGSWMNDSGFWIFTKMGGLTEVESLKSWTPMLCVLGITAMAVTTLLAVVLPLQ